MDTIPLTTHIFEQRNYAIVHVFATNCRLPAFLVLSNNSLCESFLLTHSSPSRLPVRSFSQKALTKQASLLHPKSTDSPLQRRWVSAAQFPAASRLQAHLMNPPIEAGPHHLPLPKLATGIIQTSSLEPQRLLLCVLRPSLPQPQCPS